MTEADLLERLEPHLLRHCASAIAAGARIEREGRTLTEADAGPLVRSLLDVLVEYRAILTEDAHGLLALPEIGDFTHGTN